MSDEQAQQLMYQMQMLENYLGELTHKEQTFVSMMREASSAVESIKSFTEKSESSTLVPMGMGSFAKAKISSSDKLIINLGADVAIEKDKDSALNFLEARIKELDVALRDTNLQKQQVMGNLEQGKQEINRLIQASQSKKQ